MITIMQTAVFCFMFPRYANGVGPKTNSSRVKLATLCPHLQNPGAAPVPFFENMFSHGLNETLIVREAHIKDTMALNLLLF